MVPLDPKTGSTLEEKQPLEDGRQPPPSNPNNNPKHTLDNSDKASNHIKQKRQKHDYFYSFILMNLLYEDMHDTTYDDLQTHTKQIENPSISFDEYIANIKRGMGEGKGDNNPNPNPGSGGVSGNPGSGGGCLATLTLTLTLTTHPTLWEMMRNVVPSLDTLIPIRPPHLIV